MYHNKEGILHPTTGKPTSIPTGSEWPYSLSSIFHLTYTDTVALHIIHCTMALGRYLHVWWCSTFRTNTCNQWKHHHHVKQRSLLGSSLWVDSATLIETFRAMPYIGGTGWEKKDKREKAHKRMPISKRIMLQSKLVGCKVKGPVMLNIATTNSRNYNEQCTIPRNTWLVVRNCIPTTQCLSHPQPPRTLFLLLREEVHSWQTGKPLIHSTDTGVCVCVCVCV